MNCEPWKLWENVSNETNLLLGSTPETARLLFGILTTSLFLIATNLSGSATRDTFQFWLLYMILPSYKLISIVNCSVRTNVNGIEPTFKKAIPELLALNSIGWTLVVWGGFRILIRQTVLPWNFMTCTISLGKSKIEPWSKQLQFGYLFEFDVNVIERQISRSIFFVLPKQISFSWMV